MISNRSTLQRGEIFVEQDSVPVEDEDGLGDQFDRHERPGSTRSHRESFFRCVPTRGADSRRLRREYTDGPRVMRKDRELNITLLLTDVRRPWRSGIPDVGQQNEEML